MRVVERLARLDERVLPARMRRRAPNEAAQARIEIKVGLLGLVVSGIIAVATGHWELLGTGAVFLIVGIVRLRATKAVDRNQP